MDYQRLGRSGLQVSRLAFGSWLTFGPQLDFNEVRRLMGVARDHGVNFFDNAEAYASGVSETLMGQALREYRREEVVVSTKIYWGGEGVNSKGLSWKHMVEGLKNSLRRMDLEYVDLLYCHRPDPDTPIEETVRAIDTLQRQGHLFYWGTSEWPADRIAEAHHVAREIGAAAPTVEQPQYNLLHRLRVEEEYSSLYERYGMGLTTWSPLSSGVLTGKYLEDIPEGSRLDRVEWLRERLCDEHHEAVRRLQPMAEELGCSLSQLAIAWCLGNPRVSSVILGATSEDQLLENLGSLEVHEKIDDAMRERISDAVRIEE